MRNGGQDHTAQRSELFLRERRGQRESEAARSGHSGMRQHRGAARHRTDGVLPGKAQRRQDRHGKLAGGQGVSGANLCTCLLYTSLGTLDPGFSMPAAVLIIQCALFAVGIVLLMIRPAHSKR